jgi:hypothetical protein
MTLLLSHTVCDKYWDTLQELNKAKSVDPIIFRGLKSITLGNSQQQSLLRLAAEGISV